MSHRLDEVLKVADRVYVLRDGQCVAEAEAGKASPEQLLGQMVGRQISDGHYSEDEQVPYDDSEPVLRAEGVGTGPDCRDVSFELHKGEVLGIAGVIGSGREELCRAIASVIVGGNAITGGPAACTGW